MATATAQQVGKVIQIIGPVIDVEFEEGHLPAIYNALRIVDDGAAGGEKIDIITEVEQHLGEGRVRTVAMKPTDGLQRGMKALDTGAPISVPVGALAGGVGRLGAAPVVTPGARLSDGLAGCVCADWAGGGLLA